MKVGPCAKVGDANERIGAGSIDPGGLEFKMKVTLRVH